MHLIHIKYGPENKKLKKRIEYLYLKQMLS